MTKRPSMFIWSKDYSKEFKYWKFWSKCPSCGAFHWIIRLVNSDGERVSSFKILRDMESDTFVECQKCQQKVPVFSSEAESSHRGSDQPTIQVAWSSDVERVQSASEIINVPVGVTITVKRSRTIEHTIDIRQRESSGGSVELGTSNMISVSVRRDIEREKGQTYQESEQIGYEVELNGEKSQHYALSWVDIWRVGTAQLKHGKGAQEYSIRFRERSELEVVAE